MGDYALYQALKSYVPSSEDELEFQKSDVFQVSVESPFATSQTRRPGWLYAYNRRTRAIGYVPVECVKLLGSEVGKTIHHPSACGVEVSNNKLEAENKQPEHKLEDVYFLTPILCKHCKDYIWGQGHIGVKCKDYYFDSDPRDIPVGNLVIYSPMSPECRQVVQLYLECFRFRFGSRIVYCTGTKESQ